LFEAKLVCCNLAHPAVLIRGRANAICPAEATKDFFKELVKRLNIIGMKDSHRTTQAFMNLQKLVKGKSAFL
jgi:hypothetical protein